MRENFESDGNQFYFYNIKMMLKRVCDLYNIDHRSDNGVRPDLGQRAVSHPEISAGNKVQ